MKKWLICSLVITGLFVGGCSKKEDKKTILQKKPIEVEVEQVARGDLVKLLCFKGSVAPWRKANIQPDVSGRILNIYKKPGDRVRKGDLLAQLDTTTLQLQLKQAQAALEVAKAGRRDAQINFARLKKLYEKEAISQMQYEKWELGLEAAYTQEKSAEANLNVVKHTLGNSFMKAPFAGIVTNKYLEEGDMINPMMGMTPGVLTVMDLEQVKILLDVPSEEIEQVQIGQECQVKISSWPSESFNGKVYSKNLAADPVSKTFKVEIQVGNSEIKIKAGVFAEVAIEVLRKKDVLLIPISSLINDSYVITLEEGKAKKVNVKVGLRNQSNCEILSGLNIGDKVVTVGNYDLKEGSPLKQKGDN